MSHTPGPWRYDASTKQIRTVDESSNRFSGELIGSVSPLNPEMPDNARLIAAAPELLAALECVESEILLDGHLQEVVSAAITKAKGV